MTRDDCAGAGPCDKGGEVRVVILEGGSSISLRRACHDRELSGRGGWGAAMWVMEWEAMQIVPGSDRRQMPRRADRTARTACVTSGSPA
jgi:hypothetical protein